MELREYQDAGPTTPLLLSNTIFLFLFFLLGILSRPEEEFPLLSKVFDFDIVF